jgi:hypothetical protein
MHKYQLLRQRANELHAMLIEYSRTDSDVDNFMNFWLPWYERVKRREILIPCYDYKLGIYFANPDLSPLAVRYGYATPRHPLADAVTNFSEAIGDRLSDPNYLAQLLAAGEEPSAILDEKPPPEEEAFVPHPVSPKMLECAIVKWFRWRFK